jgi:hypothetical protein
MLSELREADRAEASARLYSTEVVARQKWAFCLEDEQGQFVASMAIVPDGPRRGWFVSYPGARIRSAAQLRPLFHRFTMFRDSLAVYDELRAWVASDDARAIRFAEWYGFRHDCGPATGFSPNGRDMSLFLWRS